jgi:hypothetical protein
MSEVGPTDQDLPCVDCGYNLRGLPAGRAVPGVRRLDTGFS